MKLTNGKAEVILANLITEWEKEGDIQGNKLNQSALARLTHSNWIVLQLFHDAPGASVTFETPKRTHSFTSTDVVCPILEFERSGDKPSKQAALMQELLRTVDYFSISPVSAVQMHLRFSVDGLWSE